MISPPSCMSETNLQISLGIWERERERERIKHQMGRSPCSQEGLNKGTWTAQEDKLLTDYIKAHGEGKWAKVHRDTG